MPAKKQQSEKNCKKKIRKVQKKLASGFKYGFFGSQNAFAGSPFPTRNKTK